MLEPPYTVGGRGVAPPAPHPPLDLPPPSPLPMFEADSQIFASAPAAPRGFKLNNFRPAFGGDQRGTIGGGRSQPTPPPPPLIHGWPAPWAPLRGHRTRDTQRRLQRGLRWRTCQWQSSPWTQGHTDPEGQRSGSACHGPLDVLPTRQGAVCGVRSCGQRGTAPLCQGHVGPLRMAAARGRAGHNWRATGRGGAPEGDLRIAPGGGVENWAPVPGPLVCVTVDLGAEGPGTQILA